eukprot:403364194
MQNQTNSLSQEEVKTQHETDVQSLKTFEKTTENHLIHQRYPETQVIKESDCVKPLVQLKNYAYDLQQRRSHENVTKENNQKFANDDEESKDCQPAKRSLHNTKSRWFSSSHNPLMKFFGIQSQQEESKVLNSSQDEDNMKKTEKQKSIIPLKNFSSLNPFKKFTNYSNPFNQEEQNKLELRDNNCKNLLEMINHLNQLEKQIGQKSHRLAQMKQHNQDMSEQLQDDQEVINERESGKTYRKRESNERLTQAKLIYEDQMRSLENFLKFGAQVNKIEIDDYDLRTQDDLDVFSLNITHCSDSHSHIVLPVRMRLMNSESLQSIYEEAFPLSDENLKLPNELEETKTLNIIGVTFFDIQSDQDFDFAEDITRKINQFEDIAANCHLLCSIESKKNLKEYFFRANSSFKGFMNTIFQEFDNANF